MFNITPKIFSELEELQEEAQLLMSYGKSVSFSKNDYVTTAGEPVTSLFYMTRGLVKCFYIDGDKEVILRLMTDDSAVFGYSGFITGQPSSEFIQCLESCEGLIAPLDKIEAARRENPKIDLLFRYMAEQHYLSLERRLMMLHHKTAKERYRYFCNTMEKRIVDDTPLHCVASYLGITPESFSRMKRELNK